MNLKDEYKLKPEFIKDHFYLKGEKIVIIENDAILNVDKDALILAKVVEEEKGTIIVPLTDWEYEEAVKKYKLLNEMFD